MTQEVDLLIHSAGQVCIVPAGEGGGPQRGVELGESGPRIRMELLPSATARLSRSVQRPIFALRYRATTEVDALGRCVIPGFVDPHTHLPWVGDRAGGI